MRWAVPIPDLAASVLVEQKVTATYTKNKSIRIAFRKGKKNKKKKKEQAYLADCSQGTLLLSLESTLAELISLSPSRVGGWHDTTRIRKGRRHELDCFEDSFGCHARVRRIRR